MRKKAPNYKLTARYSILSDEMRVLLELVAANLIIKENAVKNRKDKVYTSFSEICDRLRDNVSKEGVSKAIDFLFDRQEISADDIVRGVILTRAYAPSTEMVQETMTKLFISTPFSK
jgi:hypothetical protein